MRPCEGGCRTSPTPPLELPGRANHCQPAPERLFCLRGAGRLRPQGRTNERQGVDFEMWRGRILIGARDACGAAILFESPDARR